MLKNFGVEFDYDDINKVWMADSYHVNGRTFTGYQAEGKTISQALRNLYKELSKNKAIKELTDE